MRRRGSADGVRWSLSPISAGLKQGVIGRREHQAVGMTAILRTQLLLSASSKFARGGLLVILFSVVDAVASGRRRLRLSTSRSTRRFWPM